MSNDQYQACGAGSSFRALREEAHASKAPNERLAGRQPLSAIDRALQRKEHILALQGGSRAPRSDAMGAVSDAGACSACRAVLSV